MPDTTPPEITTSMTPTAPPQRNGNPPAAPSTSTGNGNWYIGGPVRTAVTARDDVGVTALQYSTDNGATWVDLPVTGGELPAATDEGGTSYRLRAFDAAGNNAHGNPSSTTLNQPAATGDTGVRLQRTTGRAVGDELVFEPGTVNEELAHIASIVSAGSPDPNVTLTAPLKFDHAARSAVTAYPSFVTVTVNIDSTPPTASFPGVTGNHIGHSQIITPTRTDPSPGSGGTAVRDTWLDGVWTYPLPLDASRLSLGKHTWTVGVTDVAGNGNKVTLTFVVTASFADLDAMLTRYATAGTVPSDTVASLRSKLAAAKAADDAGDKVTAAATLDSFASEANGIVNADARALLVGDSQAVGRQVRGIPDAADPGDLGVSSQVYPGQPRHLYVPPAASSHNANATFKILVIANRPDGSFRHPAIEDAEVMLQQLGAQRGFDVDVWDAQYPSQSLADTPFTSAANLAQYKVIVGDSSVGNNTFSTAYRMKDGTVVNEQAAFQQYIEAGGGYVALHGADDSMHNWQWYKDMLGGLFVSHPSNANAFGTDCGTCYWAELITEDPSHPATTAAGKPTRVPIADELYHYDRKPRPFVHPLMLLNEDTYKSAIGVNSNGSLENGDHPITWCNNYDGGRTFAQVLGHNWELFDTTPWFRESIYQGILTAGGLKYANCVTHTEVKTLIAKLAAAGGITADAAAAGTAAVDAAFTKYMTLTQSGYSASLGDINSLRDIAQNPASGDANSRAQLLFKAQELKNWMQVLLGSQDVGGSAQGTVPATLALSMGPAATFGAFTPGVAKTYTASTTANVISTAGDATLSVSDASSNATGRLVNGAFSLVAPVQVAATSALGAGMAMADVGGSSAPTNVLTYGGPASNDAVTLNFSQAIGANDPLRTGSYSKTFTFTLSTTTP